MTKELLHSAFDAAFDKFTPALTNAVNDALTGENTADNTLLNAALEQVKAKAKDEIVERFYLGSKDQATIDDLMEDLEDLVTSDAVQDLISGIMGNEIKTGGIEAAVRAEMNGFRKSLEADVLTPEFNKNKFIAKTNAYFAELSADLNDDTDFDTTGIVKPFIAELKAITRTLADSERTPEDVATYRQDYAKAVAKYEDVFADKSANQLYSLVFKILRNILDLIAPFLPQPAQLIVSQASAFFAPSKDNANNQLLKAKTDELRGNLDHQAIITPEAPAVAM